MEETFEEARTALESQGHRINMIKYVEITGSSIWKTERVAAVTDLGLALLKKKSSTIKDLYLWQTLEGIVFKGDTVHLKFGRTIIGIKTPEFSQVLGAISDVIQRVLTKEELSNAGLYNIPVQKAVPNPLSIISRLTNLIKLMKIKISNTSLTTLKTCLKYMDSILDTSNFEDIAIIYPLVIDVLKMSDVISTAIFTETPNFSPYKVAAEYLMQKTRTSNLVFDGKLSNEYNNFIKSLTEGQHKVTGLYFENCLFNETQLDDLSKACAKREIGALGFNACIDTGAINFFYSTFLRSPISEHLVILNLDNTQNINLEQLFMSIPYILVLSLANCELEISTVFKAIFNAPLLRLHGLNVSGNASVVPVDEFRGLPSSLSSISADNVSWSEGSFIPFIRLVLRSFSAGVKLSIARANCSTDEWVRIANFLSQGDFISLQSLIWDGNPVPPKFFHFLQQNRGLEFLSLSECISENYIEPVNALTQYLIRGPPSLKHFFLRSGPDSRLGSLLPKVALALRNCVNLATVDLSGSHCGDEGLSAVGMHLLDSKRGRTIIVDGVEPNNIEAFSSFVNLATGSPGIHLAYPKEDIKYIQEHSLASRQQIINLKHQFAVPPRPRKGKSACFNPPSRSIFDEAFAIAPPPIATQFPKFFTRRELDQLRTAQSTQLNLASNTGPESPVASVRSPSANSEQAPLSPSKRLNERMNTARRLLYGENAAPIKIDSSDGEVIPMEAEQTPEPTLAADRMTTEDAFPTGSAFGKRHRRRRGRGSDSRDAEELPRASDSRVSSHSHLVSQSNGSGSRGRNSRSVARSKHSRGASGEKKASDDRGSTARSRASSRKAAIVPEWSFPTIRLAVDVNEFWDEMEEDFSIQNLFGDIREERQH